MLDMPSRSDALRWAALLVGLPLLALALVVSADAIPDRFVAYRLRDAIVTGQLDERSYGVGYTGGQLDGYSECKRITIGLGAPAGLGTFESAVRSPTLGHCETAVPAVLGWADGDGWTGSYDYFRYWNGSTVVMRPTVAAVGVGGTRLLVALALAGVAVAWFWSARRLVGSLSAALLSAPLLLTTDFVDLPGALVQAIGMIVGLGAAALFLRLVSPLASRQTFAAVAFACGAASQFFGDLTNPDASWALVVSAAAMVSVGSGDMRRAIGRVGAAAIGWIAGFVWIWFTKWAIAVLVVGYESVRFVVTNKAEERLSGQVDGADTWVFSGVVAAWRAWRGQPVTALTVLALGTVAVVVLLRRGDVRSSWAPRLLLASAALIPFAWHVVLRNHTAVHFWFTYRSLAVACGIVLMAATARLDREAPTGTRSETAASERLPSQAR
jgi:hypothetical protein